MQDFEKLGAFYLGKTYDAEEGKINEELVLYDSKDLTTHAVCVGMTGSGKTGLCVGLLEEAAIDGIPAILPSTSKGDLANLLLAFPGLSAGRSFEPWVDPESKRRRTKGMSPDSVRRERRRKLWEKRDWRSWGQDGARIATLSR